MFNRCPTLSLAQSRLEPIQPWSNCLPPNIVWFLKNVRFHAVNILRYGRNLTDDRRSWLHCALMTDSSPLRLWLVFPQFRAAWNRSPSCNLIGPPHALQIRLQPILNQHWKTWHLHLSALDCCSRPCLLLDFKVEVQSHFDLCDNVAQIIFTLGCWVECFWYEKDGKMANISFLRPAAWW